MASYVFTKPDGTAQDLAEVDNEICAMVNHEPHPVDFSIEYEVVVTIALGCCMFNNTWDVTPANLERYFQDVYNHDIKMGKERKGFSHLSKILAITFLCQRYTFHAWR